MTRRSTPGLTFGQGEASPRASGYRMPAEWEPHAGDLAGVAPQSSRLRSQVGCRGLVLCRDRSTSWSSANAWRSSFTTSRWSAERCGFWNRAGLISGRSTAIVYQRIDPGFGTRVRSSSFAADLPTPSPRPIGVSTDGRATARGNVTTHFHVGSVSAWAFPRFEVRLHGRPVVLEGGSIDVNGGGVAAHHRGVPSEPSPGAQPWRLEAGTRVGLTRGPRCSPRPMVGAAE